MRSPSSTTPSSAAVTAAPPAGITLAPASGDITVPGSGSASGSFSVSAAADAKAGVYAVPLTLTSGGDPAPQAWLSVTVGVRGTVTWYVNNAGISADDQNPAANFDGGGWSYSGKALADAGVTPDAGISAAGFDFTLAAGGLRRARQHPGRRRRPGARRAGRLGGFLVPRSRPPGMPRRTARSAGASPCVIRTGRAGSRRRAA
jgi:hypothetical protein